MQMVEPEWGKTGISQELRDQLQQYSVDGGSVVDEGQHIGRKRALHLCVLIQLVEHHLRLSISTQRNDNAHPLAV